MWEGRGAGGSCYIVSPICFIALQTDRTRRCAAKPEMQFVICAAKFVAINCKCGWPPPPSPMLRSYCCRKTRKPQFLRHSSRIYCISSWVAFTLLLLLPFIFYSLVSTSIHSAAAAASTYFRLVFRGNALSDLFLTIIFWYFAFFDIRNLRRN